jgi:hypothetical protein
MLALKAPTDDMQAAMEAVLHDAARQALYQDVRFAHNQDEWLAVSCRECHHPESSNPLPRHQQHLEQPLQSKTTLRVVGQPQWRQVQELSLQVLRVPVEDCAALRCSRSKAGCNPPRYVPQYIQSRKQVAGQAPHRHRCLTQPKRLRRQQQQIPRYLLRQ